MRRKLLKLYARVLRHDWLGLVLAFVVILIGVGTESSLLVYLGAFLLLGSRMAFIVDRARRSKRQERLHIATRYAALRAAEWPLTPPPSSAEIEPAEPTARSNTPHK
jgi:hypothetical protein